MWGLVYTALSFLAALHPRGVRRISAISCLDLSTTGKSDFLLPVFTIFPHYCPIFLYIAHYSHSALLARQLYRGQEIVRTGKNFGKNHSPSPPHNLTSRVEHLRYYHCLEVESFTSTSKAMAMAMCIVDPTLADEKVTFFQSTHFSDLKICF